MDELERARRRGVVPTGRPRPGDPPLPHPAPARGRDQDRRHPRTVRALGRRAYAAAGDQRPDRHRVRDRRSARSASRSTSCAIATASRVAAITRRGASSERHADRRGPRRARDGRAHRHRAVESVDLDRSDPAGPGRARRSSRERRDDVVAVSPIINGARAEGSRRPAPRRARPRGVVRGRRATSTTASSARWIIDEADRATAPAIEGSRCHGPRHHDHHGRRRRTRVASPRRCWRERTSGHPRSRRRPWSTRATTWSTLLLDAARRRRAWPSSTTTSSS